MAEMGKEGIGCAAATLATRLPLEPSDGDGPRGPRRPPATREGAPERVS